MPSACSMPYDFQTLIIVFLQSSQVKMRWMKCDKEENLQIIKQIHRNSLSFPIFLSYAHTETQILFLDCIHWIIKYMSYALKGNFFSLCLSLS